ncbi:hypothetical protein HNR22_005605 [Micromonospora jinlongensis]|uniref:Uncharacterized protein n=1 Tax=Micromonospora jinlongensis TaxID=1287877 RepID=A0A7Y9X882_9ACTN|nr:hypothetical protein [Micromonospora jinlongensis]NYH45878.1 hypothetical protein [Micromonospora jinlongensis]
MAAWIGLLGALAGAGMALLGQYLLRRSDTRERARAALLDHCAAVVALSEDYRNRVWEERHLDAAGAVAAWDLHQYRLAEARLRILCPDRRLAAAVVALDAAGKQLGRAWRLPGRKDDLVDAAWRAHRESVDRFIQAAGKAIGR